MTSTAPFQLQSDQQSTADKDYPLAVISYIDILGFRAVIENQTANAVSRCIFRFQYNSEVHATDRHVSAAFSDLVVRVRFLDDEPEIEETHRQICAEASDIAQAQWVLAEKGYVARGAITVGRIRANGSAVYGPGLIRAYDLERGVAKYPRVILDAEVAEVLGLSGGNGQAGFTELDEAFSCGEDGLAFIDYIRIVCRDGAELTDQAGTIALHHQTVHDGLRSQEMDVRVKYEWLSRYATWAEECLFQSGPASPPEDPPAVSTKLR